MSGKSGGDNNPSRRSHRLAQKAAESATLPASTSNPGPSSHPVPPALDRGRSATPSGLSQRSQSLSSQLDTGSVVGSPPPSPTCDTLAPTTPPQSRPATLDPSKYPSPPPPPKANRTHTGTTDQPVMNSAAPEAGFTDVDKLKAQVALELGEAKFAGGKDFTERAFVNLVSSEEIADFLDKCDFYDNAECRWNNIPDGPVTDESTLYTPTAEILAAILVHFKLRDRRIVETHHRYLNHDHGDGRKKLKTAPDLMIMGRGGKYFKSSAFNSVPSYADCASPFEIKTQKNCVKDNLIQVAIYARQCFIEQQSRFKVFTAIMTETFITLYQFDRAGCMYSSEVDIHNDAETFVRFVLGLASDSEDLGFDTSIFWKNGKRYINTVDNTGAPITCRIERDRPSYFRHTIIGRASCCWKIKYKGRLYLVKDVWRSPDRPAEWEFLRKAKGKAGIVELYSYEKREVKISELRGLVGQYANTSSKERVWSRIIVVCYSGRRLDEFESEIELLEAARDIAAGHETLWKLFILHRDFSMYNLLVEKDGDKSRGIIIDLDMAIWTDETEKADDFRTGTRLFQSVAVLRGYPGADETIQEARDRGHPHDYRDDLESLFYILVWILFGFEKPHQEKPRPAQLQRWDTSDPAVAADAKFRFSMVPIKDVNKSSCFNHTVTLLLNNLRTILAPIILNKEQTVFCSSNDKLLKDRHPDASDIYEQFINHIILALNACKIGDSLVPLGHVRDLPSSRPPLGRGSSFNHTPFQSPLRDKGKGKGTGNGEAESSSLPDLSIARFKFPRVHDGQLPGPSTDPITPRKPEKRRREDNEEGGTSTKATSSKAVVPKRPSKSRKKKENTSAGIIEVEEFQSQETVRASGFVEDPFMSQSFPSLEEVESSSQPPSS